MAHISLKTFLGTSKETLLAHFAGIGGIVAGLIVAWQLNVFQSFPWAISVYPTVLIAKSVITNLFSGRLNTALHIGTIRPAIFGNTTAFHRLLRVAFVLTLMVSVAMSVVSMIFGSLFWGINTASFSDIFMVVVATMNLGLVFYLFTLSVTFAAFKKGLDLDSFIYPVIITITDIFITVCYASALYLFSGFGTTGKYCVLLVAVLPAIVILYSLLRSINEQEFIKAIRRSITALILMAIIANLTGTVLHRIDIGVSGRREIFIAYPALVALIGDVALIIGSTATTRLALGLLKPTFSGMKDHGAQILGAWTASAAAFILLSALTLTAAGTFTLSSFLSFTSLLLMANLIATVTIVLISHAFAILTFQKGLDPDHFTVPIESSLAGTMVSVALLVALLLTSQA